MTCFPQVAVAADAQGVPARRGLLRRIAAFAVVCFALAGLAAPAGDLRAQTRYTQPELEQLLAPIALYPDSVLAQVLMASAYPAEIGLAADWLRRNPTFKDKGDAAVRAVDNQPWDPSVRSLVAFPQVLDLLDANPDWTQQVGDAFIDQRPDVMSAVQALRLKAQLAGNLQSNDKLTVVSEDRTILIQTPSPQVVYVPSYNPTVVYGAWPYPTYPPIYLPPPPGYYVGTALASGIAFGVGIAVTNAIWGGFNWGGNDVNINVNNFNSIHVNNKQNYLRTGNTWEYDASHRRDVPRNDRASRDRVQKSAVAARDRNDLVAQERDRQQASTRDRPGAAQRPGSAGRPDPQRPAPRPAVPDRGAFEGLERPGQDRPAIDRSQAARPQPGARPVPSPAARPAPRPTAPTAARPAPRPAPAARPAPAPRPAARPAGGGRPPGAARHAR
ncbi:MAG: DUF3300 domain-containing protein [Burkholderiales bacterium]|nr:MAG: DUF3300 domain-containing protein [Burkholderiales bacterium]